MLQKETNEVEKEISNIQYQGSVWEDVSRSYMHEVSEDSY